MRSVTSVINMESLICEYGLLDEENLWFQQQRHLVDLNLTIV